MDTKIFVCSCSSVEHQVVFRKSEKQPEFNEDTSVYASVHLITHRNFFKRLWIGLKYAFGLKAVVKYINFFTHNKTILCF